MFIEQILKEWSSAVRFFEHKKVGLIFRKGGIHEKEFEETSSYFGIFKTFEHESKETVKIYSKKGKIPHEKPSSASGFAHMRAKLKA